MRELNYDDMDQASGGILAVIGFGPALAGMLGGGSGVVGWAVSSASLWVALYELAK